MITYKETYKGTNIFIAIVALSLVILNHGSGSLKKTTLSSSTTTSSKIWNSMMRNITVQHKRNQKSIIFKRDVRGSEVSMLW